MKSTVCASGVRDEVDRHFLSNGRDSVTRRTVVGVWVDGRDDQGMGRASAVLSRVLRPSGRCGVGNAPQVSQTSEGLSVASWREHQGNDGTKPPDEAPHPLIKATPQVVLAGENSVPSGFR